MATLRQFLNDKSNKSEIDQYFEEQAEFYVRKRELERIDNFNGYFDFLNNEFPCPVYYDGLMYKGVSYAYQAARCTEQYLREKIAKADTIMEMYEIAAKIEDPPDWQKNRLKVMEMLIRDKFRRNAELREKLRATETRELVNTYRDPTVSNLFWGVVDKKGQNQLGRILELVRNDIHHDIELQKWLFMNFNLEDDHNLIPVITLEVYKGDSKIEVIKLKDKNHYSFGKLTGSDVLMTHQSISRRHGLIIVDSKFGVCLMDLGSKCGTFLDNKKIDICFPYRLNNGNVIVFGASTRRYVVNIDYSAVEKYLAQKAKIIAKEIKLYEAAKDDPNADIESVKAALGLIARDTIFVGGLPENPSQKEVEEFFSQFGKIKEIRIPIDRQTGRNKTIAFITYADEKDCKKALENDRIRFKDRRLTIKIAEKKNSDQIIEEKLHGGDRDSYKDKLKKNEDKARKDIDKRYNRRRRSRTRSRSHSKEHRSGRKKNEKRRSKERRKRSMSSESSSASSSRSRSRSRSKSREKTKQKEKRDKDSKRKDKSESPVKIEKDKESRKEKERRKKKSESPSESPAKTKKKEESSSSSESDSESGSESESRASTPRR